MWATPETRPTETTRVVIRTTDRASPWRTGLTLQILDVLRSALRSESGILVLLFVWLHYTLGEMKVVFFTVSLSLVINYIDMVNGGLLLNSSVR